MAARVVQAAGGGALVPIAMAASADMFPPGRRALVLGIIGGAAEAGGVLGPHLRSRPPALWNWRLIFLVNVPLCLILIPVCWRLLRPAELRRCGRRGAQAYAESAPDEISTAGRTVAASALVAAWTGRLRGSRLMALALAGVTIGLGTGTQTIDSTAAAATPVKWPWLVVSAVAFVAFVLYRAQPQRPLIRLDFFKRPASRRPTWRNLLVGAALIIGMVEIPLYAYTLFGMTEIEGGLLLIRLTLMIPVGAVVGGWLADLLGYRITAVLGFLVAAGAICSSAAGPSTPADSR